MAKRMTTDEKLAALLADNVRETMPEPPDPKVKVENNRRRALYGSTAKPPSLRMPNPSAPRGEWDPDLASNPPDEWVAPSIFAGNAHADSAGAWFYGNQNKADPVENPTLGNLHRYGKRGAGSIARYHTARRINQPIRTVDDTTPAFLANPTLVDEWTPTLVGAPKVTNGPNLSLSRDWPETAAHTSGFMAKRGARSSWYNGETTVDGRPHTSVDSIPADASVRWDPEMGGGGGAVCSADRSTKSHNHFASSLHSHYASSQHSRSRLLGRPKYTGKPFSANGLRGSASVKSTASVAMSHKLQNVLDLEQRERDLLRVRTAEGNEGALGGLSDRRTVISAITDEGEFGLVTGGPPRGPPTRGSVTRGGARARDGGGGRVDRDTATVDSLCSIQPESKHLYLREMTRQGEPRAQKVREFGYREIRSSGAQLLITNSRPGRSTTGPDVQWGLKKQEVLRVISLVRGDERRERSGGVVPFTHDLARTLRGRVLKHPSRLARFDSGYIDRDCFIEVMMQEVHNLSSRQASQLFSLFDEAGVGRVAYARILGTMLVLCSPRSHSAMDKVETLWKLFTEFMPKSTPKEKTHLIFMTPCHSVAHDMEMQHELKTVFRPCFFKHEALKASRGSEARTVAALALGNESPPVARASADSASTASVSAADERKFGLAELRDLCAECPSTVELFGALVGEWSRLLHNGAEVTRQVRELRKRLTHEKAHKEANLKRYRPLCTPKRRDMQ